MPQRHPLMYDVERWRYWRPRLLGLVSACLLAVILGGMFQGQNTTITQVYSLGGAFLAALALVFWLRARFSYMRVEDEALLIRVAVSGKQRIPLAEMRRPKLARLRSVLDRPERQRLVPRGARHLLDKQALVVRLEEDAVDLVRLRRLVGPQCLIGRDLVLPVGDDGSELLSDLESHIAPTRAAADEGGRNPRSQSKRRRRR